MADDAGEVVGAVAGAVGDDDAVDVGDAVGGEPDLGSGEECGCAVAAVDAPPTAGLINELVGAQAQLRLSKLEAALLKLDLLILDEVGFVPFSKTGYELLFGVLSERYEQLSVIVTSNLDFASWTEIFGDARLTGALLDRLTHRAHIIEFQGDSYSFKESLRRKTRART
jgi:hypothetical protein